MKYTFSDGSDAQKSGDLGQKFPKTASLRSARYTFSVVYALRYSKKCRFRFKCFKNRLATLDKIYFLSNSCSQMLKKVQISVEICKKTLGKIYFLGGFCSQMLIKVQISVPSYQKPPRYARQNLLVICYFLSDARERPYLG